MPDFAWDRVAPALEPLVDAPAPADGGGTAPTPLEHLARRPAEDRKAGIEDLSARVGNRQVSRMIAGE